jgi:pimeloyl-ACP methyl ester carboxylesterase
MTGIVLIHGGAHGGWCWDKIIPALDHRAVATNLPGRPGAARESAVGVSMADSADAVVNVVNEAGFKEVILVAHSLGGTVLPLAARTLGTRVKHVVFLSAVVIPAGGAVLDLVPAALRGVVERAAARSIRRHEGTFTLPQWAVRHYFCNGLSAQDRHTVLSSVCPEPARPLIDRPTAVTLDRQVPRTYIGFRHDRALRPTAQRRLANWLDTPLITLEGGHDGMMSNVAGVSRIINWVARE